MTRFFNTTGPCNPDDHFMLAPRARLPDLMPFIEQKLYFIIHAARQTGKTTAMRGFAEELRGMGMVALWATLEEARGEPAVDVAEARWLDAIQSAGRFLPEGHRPPELGVVADRSTGGRLRNYLQRWCEQVGAVPVVLLLDEADTLVGPAMVNLLSQLRAGFMDRGPGRFPVSIALIGMRDLRDYLTASKDGKPVNPGSPFNVKSDSLTLRNFTQAEVAELLGQHTEETGQVFLPEALSRVFYWGQGQPFLTNALARILTMKLVPCRDQSITEMDVDIAKEQLILSRTTHLDSLSQRLREERVARVLQRVLLGDGDIDYEADDFQYTLDLGLVIRGPDGAEMANPLYREVLVRELTYNRQENLPRPWWRWSTPGGGLDIAALFDAFTEWWREHAEMVERNANKGYLEAVPHITLMAFLQKVANGGGTIRREYAAGRGRIDLLVEYKSERHAIELKRVFDGGYRFEKVKKDGIVQLSGYLDSLGLTEGLLWIFDQRAGKTWEERLWSEDIEVGGRTLHLRGG